MRVAIMGSIPVFPYRDEVRFWNDRPDLTSTWNLNLARALARIDDCEVHFLTNAPLLKTQVIQTDGFHLHFVGHLPKVNYWDYLSRFRYSKAKFDRLIERTLQVREVPRAVGGHDEHVGSCGCREEREGKGCG